MSSTLKDLRQALDQMAQEHHAPDPHAMLSGAHKRANHMGKRRTVTWLAAVAAVVAVIGGAGVLLNNGDDTVGQIEPAEPDTSYTDGYGIVDGIPQPYMDGMQLLDTATIDPGQERILELDDVSGDDQLFAVAWCADETIDAEGVSGVIFARSGELTFSPPCYDQAENANSNQLATPLPPLEDAYLFANQGDESATVAVYAESEWRDYPFPSVDPSAFPPASAGSLVIDATTPTTQTQPLESIPETARVRRARIPITDAPAKLTVEMNRPGQVLVAINGVVLSNDGEQLAGQPSADSTTWADADPGLREGFVMAFAPPVAKSFVLDRSLLDQRGVDAGDGEVEVSVSTRGFVSNASWRVTYSTEATADLEPLSPVAETDFPEYAMGHRLVQAFEVPSDGVPWPLQWEPEDDTQLTWVADCTAFWSSSEGGVFQTDIATVRASTGVGRLSCFSDNGWHDPLGPQDFASGPSPDRRTVTALATSDSKPRLIAAYEPVAFDDFPFHQAGDVLALAPMGDFDGDAAEEQRADGPQFVERDTEVVTLDDLDRNGTTVLEVPATRMNQFYVTTEGKGRFWIEPISADGDTLTASASLHMGLQSMGRDDYWTSWTSDQITWLIEARTDAGDRPEQVRLRVEGYRKGSFTFRVTGQFPVEDQP